MSAAKQTVNLPLPPPRQVGRHMGVLPKALLFNQTWLFPSALHPGRSSFCCRLFRTGSTSMVESQLQAACPQHIDNYA